jgi:hypothetical protein
VNYKGCASGGPCEDLGVLTKELGWTPHRRVSLANACYMVTGKVLDKAEHRCTAQWDSAALSPEAVSYACLDAVASVLLWRDLTERVAVQRAAAVVEQEVDTSTDQASDNVGFTSVPHTRELGGDVVAPQPVLRPTMLRPARPANGPSGLAPGWARQARITAFMTATQRPVVTTEEAPKAMTKEVTTEEVSRSRATYLDVSPSAEVKVEWPCCECTFLNVVRRTRCEMCGMRRSVTPNISLD